MAKKSPFFIGGKKATREQDERKQKGGHLGFHMSVLVFLQKIQSFHIKQQMN